MPVAIQTAVDQTATPLQPPRKRWTRAECAAVENAGLWNGQHWELIEGELFNKMGNNRRHISALVQMQRRLVETFGWERVNPEAPVNVAPEDNPTSEPEPDVIVLAEGFLDSRTSQPQATDLAEVADTTLRFDLTVKASLYARAAMVEYWVVDLNGRRLIAHRDPQAGVYQSVIAYAETESVAPLAAPEHGLLVSQVLG